MSNFAFMSGSSKQGKPSLAYVAEREKKIIKIFKANRYYISFTTRQCEAMFKRTFELCNSDPSSRDEKEEEKTNPKRLLKQSDKRKMHNNLTVFDWTVYPHSCCDKIQVDLCLNRS